MRVFVSSTFFDLIDVRSEIADLLRSLGVTPVLSDDKLSDFTVKSDVNVIETCLINVKSCDQVIVVLDKRYGPKLGEFGFDDVSATHLEYRHAVKQKKPIHFYVRDRLEADYTIWKKNRRKKNVKLSWVGEEYLGLLELLQEHSQLKANAKTSNWYTTFTSSVDLKASLRRYFETTFRPQQLVEAISQNRFPLFDVELDLEMIDRSLVQSLSFRCKTTNIGLAAAFNFRTYWQGKAVDQEQEAIMAPGQSTSMCSIYNLGPKHKGAESTLFIEYESGMGVRVIDEFRISGRVVPGNVAISGAHLEKRTFSQADKPLLEIVE